MTDRKEADLDDTQLMSAAIPSAATGDDRLAQIMDDYLVSLEQRTPLDLDRLTSQYPELADEIRSMAASLEVLHHATEQMRPAADQQSGAQDEVVRPKRLGDFEIGDEIGRGGMGVVYEARQLSLQRQVALKVLPFAAMWDQKQIARFRNEALAAAQLHHPNIVPVFAVGQERGVHFYAMQYIEGHSLDQVVEELKRENVDKKSKHQAIVSTALRNSTRANARPTSNFSSQQSQDRAGYCRAVAQLGRQAAAALQHAHEYGIVHRDIKPSNLMVDGQAKLWITDFGLARIQSSPSVTMTGDVVGTLRYMSPEQAAGQPALVDGRTDIYSLGATLYELLTLQPAFPGEDRHAVLRDIEANEPLPPRSINPTIPVDLETIVLQAMAKPRDSRYLTSQALGEDLQRFLDGKPTLARRPTIVDRTAKWMRRHRSFVGLAAMFLITLTIGSSVAAFKIAAEQERTKVALADAQRNLDRAEEHFAQARQVVDRFGIQLADQLQDTPGTERLRQQLLVETLNYYRGFAEHIEDDLDIQDQLALTHLKTGAVTAKLGAHQKAIAEYRAAQLLLEQLLAADGENNYLHSQLALSHNNTALLLAKEGKVDAARREYAIAIDTQRQLVATSLNDWNYFSQLAESYLNLGTLLGQAGEMHTAIDTLRNGIEILQAATSANPNQMSLLRSLAMAHNNLGYLQRDVDPTHAEQSARQAVELLEQLPDSATASDECLADLSLCYCNLAAIQGNSGRTPAAIISYQRAVALRESLLRKSPSVVRHRSELAANLNNLALSYIRLGNSQAASGAFCYANRLFSELLEDFPSQTAYASGWAALLNNQGLALAKIDRYDAALHAYARASEIQARVFQQLPGSSKVRETLSRIYYNYGQALKKIGRFGDAAKQAILRRSLWQENGPRSFSVAVELAEIAASEKIPGNDQLTDELIATLRQALDAGYQPKIELSFDARFRKWHDHPIFQSLSTPPTNKIVTTTSHQ